MAEVLEKDPESLKMSDHFKEYDEWDSLAVLSVMAVMEEEYGVVISRNDLDRCETMEDLYTHVTSHGK